MINSKDTKIGIGSITDFLNEIGKQAYNRIENETLSEVKKAFLIGNLNVVTATLYAKDTHIAKISLDYEKVKKEFEYTNEECKDIRDEVQDLKKLRELLERLFEAEDRDDKKEVKHQQISLAELFPEIFKKVDEKKKTEKKSKKE